MAFAILSLLLLLGSAGTFAQTSPSPTSMAAFPAPTLPPGWQCTGGLSYTVPDGPLLAFNPPNLALADVSAAGGQFAVTLLTQPTAKVTVFLSSPGDVALSACSLTFTPANWNVPQNVTATATPLLDTNKPASDAFNITAQAHIFGDQSGNKHLQTYSGTRDYSQAGMCTVTGDPHISTFDNYAYTFFGVGVFEVVQSPNLVIQTQTFQCNTWADGTVVSCQQSLAVGFKDQQIILSYVNGQNAAQIKQKQGSAQHMTISYAEATKSWNIAICDGTNIRLNVLNWNNVNYFDMQITLPASYKNAVSGLCGNFNGNNGDELPRNTTPDNSQGYPLVKVGTPVGDFDNLFLCDATKCPALSSSIPSTMAQCKLPDTIVDNGVTQNVTIAYTPPDGFVIQNSLQPFDPKTDYISVVTGATRLARRDNAASPPASPAALAGLPADFISDCKLACSTALNITVCEQYAQNPDRQVQCEQDCQATRSFDLVENSKVNYAQACHATLQSKYDSLKDKSDPADQATAQQVEALRSYLGLGGNDCPGGCGDGTCAASGCVCNYPFTGRNCEFSLAHLKRPLVGDYDPPYALKDPKYTPPKSWKIQRLARRALYPSKPSLHRRDITYIGDATATASPAVPPSA